MREIAVHTELKIPITYMYDSGYHVIVGNDDTQKTLDLQFTGQGKTREEAEKKAIECAQIMVKHYQERAKVADRWEPFAKGDWGHQAGKWFRIFGFQFYFRIGENMKHGFYIPFTKINTMFTNYHKL